MSDLTPDVKALIARLHELPSEWRQHACRDGSHLYQAGFDYCADALEAVLGDIASASKPPYIKCLLCGAKSYHPKDIEARYCGRCHTFHDLCNDGVTHELGVDF